MSISFSQNSFMLRRSPPIISGAESMHHSANCTLYSLSVHLLPMPTLPLPYMPTVSISMSLKQKLPLSQKLGSCDLTISVKDTKLSMISPVERYMCAPMERIQCQGSSRPQLQAENRISRPVALSAMDMVW